MTESDMLAKDIKPGALYVAKVAGELTVVKVDKIETGRGAKGNQTYYGVTNLRSGRRTVFRSAAKFRWESPDGTLVGRDAIHGKPVRPFRANDDEFPPSSIPVPPLPGRLAAIFAPEDRGNPAPHLIVKARAGTGKTTTLVEGLRILRGGESELSPSPQQRAVWDAMAAGGEARSVCFIAFNKAIAEELKRRVPEGVAAMTLHSLGFAAVRAAFPGVRVDDRRTVELIAAAAGEHPAELRKRRPVLLKAVERLVGLCKTDLADGAPEELEELAARHDIETDRWKGEIFGLVPRVLAAAADPAADRRVDFDDMVWLPVRLGLPVARHDVLLVDEAQDLNRCQQALARKAGRRLILCGDEAQAIYGFAGADSDSIPRMERELGGDGAGCESLPLTVTRRCGKAIVEEARRFVPDFSAHESNPPGKISAAKYPRKADAGAPEVPWADSYGPAVADGDMVLCRTNAPLIAQCFRFLRAGRKATIRGRDVGAGLAALVRKLAGDGPPVPAPEMVRRLGEWARAESEKELAKRTPSENKLAGIEDRRACLAEFIDAAGDSAAVAAKIEAVFSDNQGEGVKLSSIHRAKGLESRRVWLLKPPGTGPRRDKMQAWELRQEDNLEYVAITRAIEELIYVR